MIRSYIVSTVLLLLVSPLLCGQDYNPSPKAMDGRIDEWGIPGRHWTDPVLQGQPYLYENEAQGNPTRNLPGNYVNGPDNDKTDPTHLPGHDSGTDEPLNNDLLVRKEDGMASGFNIISSLLSFDPTKDNGTFWVAWDLPGPTNPSLSGSHPTTPQPPYEADGYYNLFIFEDLGSVDDYWYPIPFDADCNENREVIDRAGDPGTFGSIDDAGFPGGMIETSDEHYTVELWVGDNQGYSKKESSVLKLIANQDSRFFQNLDGSSKLDRNGFPIYIELWQAPTQPYHTLRWKAFIPGFYLKSGVPLYLGYHDPDNVSPPPILDTFTHSNPMDIIQDDPDNNDQYEIEIKLTNMFDLLPLINSDNCNGYSAANPVDKWAVYHSYALLGADADGDHSDEEWVPVHLDVPALEMIYSVDKKVFCGSCTPGDKQSSFPGNDVAYALPGADILFELQITIPEDNPGQIANGMGEIWGRDLLPEINNNILPGSLELCTDLITVTGDSDLNGHVIIPDFSTDGTDWAIIDDRTGNPMLFDPSAQTATGDIVVVIPFKVTVHPNYNVQGQQNDIDNTITIYGKYGGETGAEISDSVFVNVLVPELSCAKFVEIYDKDNNLLDSGSNPVANPLVEQYPIRIDFTLTMTNTGETELDLLADAFEDECLCMIPDLVPIPFCNGQTVTPGLLTWGASESVKVSWTVESFSEFTDAVNVQIASGICDFNPPTPNRDYIFNFFKGLASVVVDGTAGGIPYYLCNDGAPEVECTSNTTTTTIRPPDAVIEVEKLVSCFSNGPFTKSVTALPGADVYFKLTVSNPLPPVGTVDHDHTLFNDELVGEAIYTGNFQILSAHTIQPANFNPDGTIFEINPPLALGESFVMIFEVETNALFNTMGTPTDVMNTLNGACDGPDAGTAPDDQESDFAEINIVVPGVNCEKSVTVTTDVGGTPTVHGPAQTISDISRIEEYPWNVQWDITVNNTGETYLFVPVTDLLIKNYTQNDCNLPKTLYLAPGASETIVCTEVINDYNENVVLDTNDQGGFNDWVHNWAAGANIQVDENPAGGPAICYQNNGQPVEAYNPPDIVCDAKYNLPAPCAVVAIVDKQVSCFENTGYGASVEAFPDTWVYFRITVKNNSPTIPIENCYVTDQLTGEYLPGSFTAITPPDFKLAPNIYNLGAMNPLEEITIKYKVKTNPAYDTVGVPEEIFNKVIVAADGPDADPDPDPYPDPCNEAYAELTKGTVNILVPELDVHKVVLVTDNNGITYPADGIAVPQVWLDENAVYPITIDYTVTVTNDGDVDLPAVELEDEMLFNLSIGSPPGIVTTFNPNPWDWVFPLAKSTQKIQYATVVCDDLAEAQVLAGADYVPHDVLAIDNYAVGTQPAFTVPDVCGESPELTDGAPAKVHLFEMVNDIPALDWVGVILMILTLGGLMIWRGSRG